MENTIFLLTKLLAHKLNGRGEPVPFELPDVNTVKKLLHLAKKHDVMALISTELLACDFISDDSLYTKVQDSLCETVCYYEKMNYEFHWLCDLLEDAEIPFIPLKGAVLRQYYPEPWLRTSGDIDILIRDEYLDSAVSLLLQKGCTLDREKRFHDIPLITPGGILLELHFNIRENIPAMDQVLDKVWQYSEPIPGRQYAHRQSNTFLLFHLLAHMAYHLLNGGCGIRSFADIWILQNKTEYDPLLLQEFCTEAGIYRFYENICFITGVWFEENQHNATSRLLENLVMNGGSFGTLNNKILINQAQSGNKNLHMLRRIFKPYGELKEQFPALSNKPWLTPVYQIFRWGRVFTDRRLNNVMKEMHTSQEHSQNQITEISILLEDVGLKF